MPASRRQADPSWLALRSAASRIPCCVGIVDPPPSVIFHPNLNLTRRPDCVFGDIEESSVRRPGHANDSRL